MNIPYNTLTPHAGLNTHSVRPLPADQVLLRSACVVEYAAKLAPHTGNERGTDAVVLDGDGEVLLTVYVRRCMLNPTRVRIVEVDP